MQKSTGPKTDPFGTPYLTVPSEESEPRIKTRCTLFLRYEQKKAMSSNCINRQKALRVRFCDQQYQTLFPFFFKSKKTALGRYDRFIAENHKSVNCVSRALQECLQQKPN